MRRCFFNARHRYFYLTAGLIMLAGFLDSSFLFGESDDCAFGALRTSMVKDQIEARGVRDKRVLSAMRKVKRHFFVLKEDIKYAYSDNALPIEHHQTISQPYIVALMTELADIEPQDQVLEIGTGSGYQAAILAEIAKKVYTIEIVDALCLEARGRLKKLGYSNIDVRCGDGYKGWPDVGPFDAIIVTACAKEVPEELVKQLKPGGRLVIPLGDVFQDLYLFIKKADGTMVKKNIIPVRFVPLIPGKNLKER